MKRIMQMELTSFKKVKLTRNSTWKRLKKHKYIYLLLLPAFVAYLVFNYAPMVGILMAFKDFRIADGFWGIFTGESIGFKQFERLFDSFYFYVVLRNTIIISVYKIIFTFPLPIIFAILLNELRSNLFKRFVQTVTYLPHFLSMVVISGLVYSVFSSSSGLINAFFDLFGLESKQYLGDTSYFRSIIVGVDMWKEAGWNAIIYLAAISTVDQQLYDSAKIDGANKFRQIWHITLPEISGIIILLFILRLGFILNAGFEQIILLYSPPVYPVADIIDTFVYRLGFVQADYGFSTAVNLFKSVVGLVLIIGANLIAKRMGKQGIW